VAESNLNARPNPKDVDKGVEAVYTSRCRSFIPNNKNLIQS